MASYVVRRILQAIPIIVGISIISFLIIHLAPGSPLDKYRSGKVSPQVLENLTVLYGLKRPLLEQFVAWFVAFWQFPFRADAWGYSFTSGEPVTRAIAERIPATLSPALIGLH